MLCSSIAKIWLVFKCFFFFKQKTAYEMRISDWSSDVCSSDLLGLAEGFPAGDAVFAVAAGIMQPSHADRIAFLQAGNARTDGSDDAGAFVAGHERQVRLYRLVAVGRDRDSAVWAKSVRMRVDHSGGRSIKKTNNTTQQTTPKIHF